MNESKNDYAFVARSARENVFRVKYYLTCRKRIALNWQVSYSELTVDNVLNSSMHFSRLFQKSRKIEPAPKGSEANSGE